MFNRKYYMKIYNKNYYWKYKGEMCMRHKKWRKHNKRYFELYYKTHQAQIKNSSKKYRDSHKKQLKIKFKRYRFLNKERIRKRARICWQTHREAYIRYKKFMAYSENNRCSCGRKTLNKSKKCRLCTILNMQHIKRIKYRNYIMKSGWEVKYAKYLTRKHIKWQYEPKTFDLGNSTYTPDFYLPDSDTYVEIKGYWYNRSKQKYLLFRRKFKNIKLLNKSRLKKLGVL